MEQQSCAYQVYFAEQGTKLLVKDPACEEQARPPPTALLLGPSCHQRSATLVCLLRGFSYPWPLEVSWKRDGEELPRPAAAATEPPRPLPSNCSFGTASRLKIPAADWLSGSLFSCHARQGDAREAVESAGVRAQDRSPAVPSGPFELALNLRTGQFIFFLLTVKSFVYGTALGIYTACRKPGGTHRNRIPEPLCDPGK